MNVSTIRQWRLQYEDFSTAIRVGKQVADERVEQALFERATGYDFDAVKVFKGDDGKAIFSEPYIEHVPPDIAAIRLWLFNRRPDRWRDKIEVTQTGILSDLPSIEIKKRLVAKMIEWGLVQREHVPPDLLPLPDGTVDDGN